MAASCHALAFGQHRSRVFRSAQEAVRETHRLAPGVIDLDFAKADDFRFQASSIDLNGLSVAAFSASAHRSHFRSNADSVMILSLSGELRFKGEELTASVEPEKRALFIPGDRTIHFETTECSTVLIRFCHERLNQTARIMLGDLWDDCVAQAFHSPAKVSLQSAGFSHDAAFRGLFAMIDSWRDQEALCEISGLADVFYRTAIMAMLPVQFARPRERPAPSSLDTQTRKTNALDSESIFRRHLGVHGAGNPAAA